MTKKQYTVTVYTYAGSLTLYVKLLKGERVKIFSNSLDQGDIWRHGSGSILDNPVDWQVQFLFCKFKHASLFQRILQQNLTHHRFMQDFMCIV